VKGILLALQFLTTLPVRNFSKTGTASVEKPEIKEEDFGKSLLYFPVIGLLIGLILALRRICRYLRRLLQFSI